MNYINYLKEYNLSFWKRLFFEIWNGLASLQLQEEAKRFFRLLLYQYLSCYFLLNIFHLWHIGGMFAIPKPTHASTSCVDASTESRSQNHKGNLTDHNMFHEVFLNNHKKNCDFHRSFWNVKWNDAFTSSFSSKIAVHSYIKLECCFHYILCWEEITS